MCLFFLALTFKYIRNHKHCFTLQWIDPGNFNNFAFYSYYFLEIQNQTTLLKFTFLVCFGKKKRSDKVGKNSPENIAKNVRSTIENRNSTNVSKMVGGLYRFKLEHSYQVITIYILRKPWPSKLYDEEIWLKIKAVYSELHEMYFDHCGI